MARITHVPPSLPIIMKRIEHYNQLEASTGCEAQRVCYSLVITELELIMEQLTEKEI